MWSTTCAGVLLSAAALGLYARVEWPWSLLGWVGFIPWLLSLDRVRSLRHAVLSGVLMSVAFVGALFWWFAVGIGQYTGAGLLIPALVVGLCAPLMQPQFVPVAVVHLLARRLDRVSLRTLLIALTYCGSEWVFPKLFGDSVGHGLYASRHLRQAADLAGVEGLTFLLLVFNLCVVESVRRWRRCRSSRAAVPVLFACAVVASLFGYGALRLRQVEADVARADTITAAVVQANIGRYADLAAAMGTFGATQYILDSHFELSRQALAGGDVDLLVWPETVYPTTFGQPKSPDGAELDAEIGRFVGDAGVPLIFGAYQADGAAEYNAAIFLAAGEPRSSFEAYRKGSLFPLTERVPWVLDSDRVRAWFPWLGTWKPGDDARVVTLARPSGPPLQIAPLICYDAVGSDRALTAVDLGADVIVTLSNDSWFSAGGGPRLHFVVSAFRSLETRRAQIRSTNTGISAFITPVGDVVTAAAVDERTAIVASVPLLRSGRTLMLLWGDWFGAFSAFSALLLVALAFAAKTKEPAANP